VPRLPRANPATSSIGADSRIQEMPGTCRHVGTFAINARWIRYRARFSVPTKEGSMKAYGRQALAALTLLALGSLALGCGEEESKGNHQIWFMGSVFDGASGFGVPAYDISLVYGNNKVVKGTVDPNTGRFTLGPLPAWNDYGVIINAQGYRWFTSYNSGIAPPQPPPASQASDVYSASTTQTFNFDAYVFPTSIQALPLTVSIVKADPTAAPAEGAIRLRPTSQPIIQDQAAGVTGQLWANDQDILAAVVNYNFSGGSLTIDPIDLVYGVSYQVTVYNVAGYQPGTATVRAGLQESLLVNIATTASPLLITGSTMTQCRPFGQSTNVTTTAQIVFTFNQSSVEDVTTVAGKGPEVIDANLTVVTSLATPLKPNASSATVDRGTSFILNGNTLSISWNPSAGLSTNVSGDTIQYVTYSGFSSIRLQPTGHPELVTTLSTLTGLASYMCYM
jgi:hypothetical protein